MQHLGGLISGETAILHPALVPVWAQSEALAITILTACFLAVCWGFCHYPGTHAAAFISGKMREMTIAAGLVVNYLCADYLCAAFTDCITGPYTLPASHVIQNIASVFTLLPGIYTPAS